MKETGWLIERYDGRAQWLAITAPHSFQWTVDSNIALRFARKTDAEAFMLFWDLRMKDGYFASGHAWG